METLKKFSPPAVSLKAYGRQQLDILSHVCVELSYGHHTVHATVLMQQGAPNHILLGMDVQSKLGFSLIVKTPEKLVDLLTGEECCRHPRLPSPDPPPSKGHSRPEDQDRNKSTEGHCSGGGMEKQAALELEETRPPESDGADEERGHPLSSSELELPLPNKLSVVPSQEMTIAPRSAGGQSVGEGTTGQHGRMMSGSMGPVSGTTAEKREDTRWLQEDGQSPDPWRSCQCYAHVHSRDEERGCSPSRRRL